ncbi:cytochrome c oxidase subunit 2 [Naumannella cuiyingiana]|uniref:Cytochrome c oxidase subunit 2 n=1 Tax=Naumannella cuiyingiana TaxID=1347891 RepID=A0A7Z0DAM6_9ACTN|nr:cytochrome c oxidase subunit 2 [Naumannella cuiyingiana]
MSLTSRRRVRPRLAAALGVLALAVVLAGCGTGGPGRARYLGLPEQSSDKAAYIGDLWVGAWIACLAVGAVVWGLMIWAFTRYRRSAKNQIPRQTTYNMPLEVMYTIVPFLIIGALFYYTLNTQNRVLAAENDQDVTIDVVGQKWSWTFNYLDESGEPIAYDNGTIENTPTFLVPVNQKIKFNLNSPDVIHSFWVPSFYFKLDVIPGRTNSFEVTPNREGTFAGKCAELCGTYHSAMLFNLKVVSQAEYDAYLADLVAQGKTGRADGFRGGVATPTVPAGHGEEEATQEGAR